MLPLTDSYVTDGHYKDLSEVLDHYGLKTQKWIVIICEIVLHSQGKATFGGGGV
jgi:hypothetical protein